ncbi:unnamed protein product [Clavelina lepadiformis]|uniref:Uncharacterized protein n=2 Tax=Clavelina lepadiformis TaxID=159417 RepID=A0ABP0GTJ7_CLALP
MHRQFVVIVIEIFIVYLLKTSALPGRSDPSTDLSPSANAGGRAIKKKNKTKSACPDTCKLKRRLGKVELSMKGKLSELEELLSSNQAVTSNVHPNISAFLVESFFNELQHNSSHHVEEIVDEAIGELKATLTESQNLITSKAEEVDELVRTIPITLMNINPVPPDVTSTMLELDSTVRQLNTTLARLTRQNAILKRQAKEANELAEIIREQNVMLSSQNNELRSSRQAIDRRSRDCLGRIQTLENLVASLSRSNGEQSKAETSSSQTENTLTSRISDMETSVVKTTRRLSQLENWIHDLAQSGGLSLSVPTTTALPQPETPPNGKSEFLFGTNIYLI